MALLIPGDGFGDRLQECLLAEGVELEEHGLAAAGGNGGKAHAMGRFQEQDTQTHPVAAKGAVPLIDPFLLSQIIKRGEGKSLPLFADQ